jgi:hypothetical protein
MKISGLNCTKERTKSDIYPFNLDYEFIIHHCLYKFWYFKIIRLAYLLSKLICLSRTSFLWMMNLDVISFFDSLAKGKLMMKLNSYSMSLLEVLSIGYLTAFNFLFLTTSYLKTLRRL